MSTRAESPRTPGSGKLVLPLYAVTLFLSAFLLFSVQPMFTKMVLPLLGGSAAVWNTAVVFFQATLLLGYFYAHLSTRYLGPKGQTLVHAVVLLVGFVSLPIGVAAWTPPTGETQIPWLIGLLAVSIGLPFFAVSATAPLLQKWFAHTDHAAAGDPYFLYGGSNLGSLAALISYPLVVERLLGLHAQGRAWTLGYALLFAVIATCGVVLVRRYRAVSADEGGSGAEEQGLIRDVTWRLRLRWLALSVVPSALLLGVTLHIGTDVASMPFLWVLPLALYLLTFVLVFARRPWFSQKWMLRAQVVSVAGVAVLYQSPSLYMLIALHISAMFFTAMVCHGEMARLRPRATHLTEFYLWMSIGGVVGGFLTAIVAPLVFSGVYEYPLALVAGLLLRPWPPASERGPLRWALDLVLPLALFFVLQREWLYRLLKGIGFEAWLELVFALILLVCLCLLARRPLRFGLAFLLTLTVLSPNALGRHESLLRLGLREQLGERLFRERSFFGVYSVDEFKTPFGRFHILQNGTTNHGGQNLDRPLGPVTYYTREGPVGQFFSIVKSSAHPVKRIGVIGLGVGALACYLSPGQTMRYFEIDSLDERIARNPDYFTFLQNAGDQVDVVVGDGRLSMEAEPDGSFDVIVIDAFSSDAIPVHLLTREAIALYERKLSENGYLFLHVTNGYLELMPIAANLIHDAGLVARYSTGVIPIVTFSGTPSDWIVAARRKEQIARFAYGQTPWPELEPDPNYGTWTDDFSNVLEVVKWKGYSVLEERPIALPGEQGPPAEE